MQIDRAFIQPVLIGIGIGGAIGILSYLIENTGKCFLIDYINKNRKILTLGTCPDKRLNFSFFPIAIPSDSILIISIVGIAAGIFALRRN